MNSEPLVNLHRIGQLDQVPFSEELFRKMLAVAQNRIQDAQRPENSAETRFDCAYTAIRATADAALLNSVTEHRPANQGTTKPPSNAWRTHSPLMPQQSERWTLCANNVT
ncbi:hypothetical protein [Limnohabitans sp. WS1]|uniref:hypothetical protein n=1 Tax=Limnohabitans sp. WS1 TaxID=1100726 RepID=UPI0018EE842E|nr:hypothetical protein [Limnohabitans sp. WS1]